jgi:hypothetical protein
MLSGSAEGEWEAERTQFSELGPVKMHPWLGSLALPKAAKGARPCFRCRGFPVRSTNCLTLLSRIWRHQSRQADLPEHVSLLGFLGGPEMPTRGFLICFCPTPVQLPS